jgi:hypothetical protein
MQPEKYNLDLSNNLTEIKKNIDLDNDSNEDIIPFWINNPNVLFQQQYIFEFFPIESMTYEQKLNTITRTIIILTIIGFILTKSFRLLIISVLTIGIIYLVYYYHELEKSKVLSKKKLSTLKEGFSSPVSEFLQDNNIPIPSGIFQKPDSSNPFSNVMMTDYDYNPNKKPAPPSFNNNINSQILAQAKQTVIESNPDQPDIADKLFMDLGEQLVFEQSMRPFYSNPGTTIPNDQGAFADFCYGSMISCKEGNAFACARNLSRHTNS